MKKLGWILIIVLFFALALLFWRLRSSRSAVSSAGVPPPSSSVSVQSPPTAPSSPVTAMPIAPSQMASGAPPISKREQAQKFLSSVNHKAIEFYGKVVDQQGVPLGGVDVYASVIYNSGLSAGVVKKQTKTDAFGLFSISGMKGRTLGIGLDKDGYEYGGEHGPFQFTEIVTEKERYHPDAKNPIVFVMWKLQGAEPLIYGDGRIFNLSPDGTPVRIDLASGKKVSSGGDLVVTLQQPMAQPGKWLEHYHWTAQLSANGLQESTARLMYLAPDDGYTSALSYGQKGDERIQDNDARKTIYLKTSDGRYARIQIVISSQTNPDRGSYIGLTWWLNPKSGSRNLEFDPARTITPKP